MHSFLERTKSSNRYQKGCVLFLDEHFNYNITGRFETNQTSSSPAYNKKSI
jgi:hypothetical protein